MIRGLKHLSSKEMLRVGVVQPGGERTQGRPYCFLLINRKGLIRKTEKMFLARPVVTGQRTTLLNWNRVDLDWMKAIFYDKDGETLEHVAGRNCGCPIKCWRSDWTGHWATWSSGICPYPWQVIGTRWPHKVPSNPIISMILQFYSLNSMISWFYTFEGATYTGVFSMKEKSKHVSNENG